MTGRRVLVVVMLVGLVVGGGVSAQQPTFSSKVESIRVDVLVTENGRPVRGLRPRDFEVFDNGVRQQVALTTFDEVPLNLVLAFDVSGSVTGARLHDLRAAGARVLHGLRPRDRAALLTFSQLVRLESPLTASVGELISALGRVEPGGQTSLIDATHAAMMVGRSDVGRSLVLVFSDGVDTASWLTPDVVLDSARRSDVVVCGVSIGRTPDAFIREVTEVSGGTSIRLESTTNLEQTFVRVLDDFRRRYLISYSPQRVSGSGWHRLEVNVKGRRVTVKARPGYLAGHD